MSGFLEHTRRPSSPRWAAGDGPSSSEDTTSPFTSRGAHFDDCRRFPDGWLCNPECPEPPSSEELARLAELTERRDRTHAQMMAAWSYWVEAKADFSIAAGELALAEYGDQP